MKKIVLPVALILSLGLIAGGAAHALTASSTLNVSATVLPTCTVSTTAVNFGNYSGSGTYANGDITVSCAQGTPYHIALDAGQNYDGVRHISNGVNSLIYGLYKDNPPQMGGTEWSDADYANTYPFGSSFPDTGTGDAQAHTVYGVLFGSEANPAVVSPGTYTDVVNVTVYY